ncbi:PLP-dependent aminotransferase family protein [Streptomyces iconiensis]|uniref:PLP-dependent aminotransferase family protein n=1 Tax=Streptomyces iconiensis TaxID=1384038 RepID=A0ABT6ZPM8_9ACTN|nr:PLP-dependent aminotransferase family protein [Streptomyces iconiensis]MDJ1131014.1 PLP-dependent aminotransferase family protein [Streptomyces iconiensis]
MHHVSPSHLSRLLAGWSAATAGAAQRPLPELLAEALRDLAERGDLASGTVLPSQRALASVLGISRSTVTAAYGTLEAEGRLESRQGSGSRLRGTPLTRERAGEGRLASFDERGHRGTAPGSGTVDLSSGALGSIAAVGEAVDALGSGDLSALLDSDGYLPYGLPALRAALARVYEEAGTPTEPGQILVTSGSQQAVWLLAQALVDHGDTVAVENPTYRGALEALRGRGARLVPLPDDGTGTPPDAARAVDAAGRPRLAGLLRRVRPRLVYLQPTAHNPTGRTFGPAARADWAALLSSLADEQGLFTVEDTSCAELVLDPGHSGAPAPLAARLPGAATATVGTLSKLFWGGLRVGWVRAAPPLVRRLAEIKKSVDLSCPVLDQVVAVRLLAGLPEARAERREMLRGQLADTEALLKQHAPGWEWERPDGGPALWLRLPGVDAEATVHVARCQGVRALAGPAFSPVDAFRDRLRLPYAHSARTLERALPVLAGAARRA